MKIGANYLTEKVEGKTIGKFDGIYQMLIQKGYLNTLKYPGKYCDIASLELLLKMLERTGCEVDIHGLPGMLPATHSKVMLANIQWDQIPEKLWKVPSFQRISTHIGLDNQDRIANYSPKEFWQTFQDNQEKMKRILREKTGREIQFGGENQPGGFQIDPETYTPEFLSQIWEKMDFGVFDIAHGKNSAQEEGISYEGYLKRLTNTQRVKIFHVSGNMDRTGKYIDKPDKHVMMDESEFSEILETISVFSNLDLIVTEYAYQTKYAYEKEIIKEIVTLKKLVESKDVEYTKKIGLFLEKELKEKGENLEEVLEKLEK